jgi:hypothetical protein
MLVGSNAEVRWEMLRVLDWRKNALKSIEQTKSFVVDFYWLFYFCVEA